MLLRVAAKEPSIKTIVGIKADGLHRSIAREMLGEGRLSGEIDIELVK